MYLCVHLLYTTEPVCKVARYTSAAPLYFNEMDDYVDGGLLANNPGEIGLTKIQNYYTQRMGTKVSYISHGLHWQWKAAGTRARKH